MYNIYNNIYIHKYWLSGVTYYKKCIKKNIKKENEKKIVNK